MLVRSKYLPNVVNVGCQVGTTAAEYHAQFTDALRVCGCAHSLQSHGESVAWSYCSEWQRHLAWRRFITKSAACLTLSPASVPRVWWPPVWIKISMTKSHLLTCAPLRKHSSTLNSSQDSHKVTRYLYKSFVYAQKRKKKTTIYHSLSNVMGIACVPNTALET